MREQELILEEILQKLSNKNSIDRMATKIVPITVVDRNRFVSHPVSSD